MVSMQCHPITPTLLLFLAILPATAQPKPDSIAAPSPPTEQVTVTAAKIEQQIHSFVQSFTAPSPAIGKLARWHDGICPIVAGTSDLLQATIVTRVREIAAQVGAPVAPASCHGNIDIVFTYNPQVLLDDVRAHHPVLLGYHDVAHEEELARVRYTVQSWYATQTADVGGTRIVDNKQNNAHTMMSIYLPRGAPGGTAPVPYDIQGASTEQVTGYHMDNGLHSELFHVVITVDAARIGDGQISGVTDYIAMLALAQTASFDTCEILPSIASVVTNNCLTQPKAITESDLAFLRALYKSDSTRTVTQQRRDIAEDMEKALRAK